MKNNRLFFLIGIFVLIISCSFSCEEDQELTLRDTERILDSLDFEFRLLNEQGVPSTIFNEGENFVFSFLIINRSSESLLMEKEIEDTTNFFRVYKINAQTEEVNQAVIDMGKPWKKMFCFFDAGIRVPPQDTAKLEILWNATGRTQGDRHYGAQFCFLENHPLLGIGEYRTGFSSAFTFLKDKNELKTEKMEFHIEFEVIP